MSKLINGQSIVDKIVTAKHTITGQDVAKAVLKASKDEVSAPKRKHIDYLVACTDNPNINILDMSKLLLDRAHNPRWVVSFKALLTIHHIMNYGSGVFFQHMASNNVCLKFGNFSDASNTVALHMSKYVRSYANYINSKAISFRQLGLDFCKVKKGNEESYFRKLEASKLIESLFILQSQVDDLLDFATYPVEISNEILSAAYLIMSKDLVRLYACYKDAVANLVGAFLRQEKKFCKEALPAYKKFLSHVDKIHEFFELSEEAGLSKFDIPRKLEISSDVMKAFEDHLKSFDLTRKISNDAPVALPRPEVGRISSLKRHSDLLERRTRSLYSDELRREHQGAKDISMSEDKEFDAFMNSFNSDFKLPDNDTTAIIRNRSATIYPMTKMSDTKESRFISDCFGTFSTLPSAAQVSPPSPPPGFMGSGQMLQPTKLYSTPAPTFSASDLLKLSLSFNANSQTTNSMGFSQNNLQNFNSQFHVPPAANGTYFSPAVQSPVIMCNMQSNQAQHQQMSRNPFL